MVWRGTVTQSEIFHTTGLSSILQTHIKWLHVHNAGNINSICWCRAMRSVEKWHADTREPAGQCKMHYCNKWLQWCIQDLWPHAKHPHSHTAEPEGEDFQNKTGCAWFEPSDEVLLWLLASSGTCAPGHDVLMDKQQNIDCKKSIQSNWICWGSLHCNNLLM